MYTDEYYINRTMDLARLGRDTAASNPMVGAVVVNADGIIIGKGWHRGPGTPHAEVNAITDAAKTGPTDFTNTTLYVNLEPCCHTGKTPPCTDLIIKTGIPRIVCGMTDPNPVVAGKGIQRLQEAGCTVVSGIMENDCRELNASFVTFHEKQRPFFTLKTASTLDGKIAAANGESRWITGEESRKSVQQLRARQAAILTGIGTVLADDPLLTVRDIDRGVTTPPSRIIADTHLRIPAESRLVRTAKEIPVISVCSLHTLQTASGLSKKKQLENAGVTVLATEEKNGHVDLARMASLLAKRGLDRILVETGGTLAWSFMEEGLVDLVRMYLAPYLLGGITAAGILGGTGAESLKKRISLANLTLFRCGEDIVLEGRPCLPD